VAETQCLTQLIAAGTKNTVAITTFKRGMNRTRTGKTKSGNKGAQKKKTFSVRKGARRARLRKQKSEGNLLGASHIHQGGGKRRKSSSIAYLNCFLGWLERKRKTPCGTSLDRTSMVTEKLQQRIQIPERREKKKEPRPKRRMGREGVKSQTKKGCGRIQNREGEFKSGPNFTRSPKKIGEQAPVKRGRLEKEKRRGGVKERDRRRNCKLSQRRGSVKLVLLFLN